MPFVSHDRYFVNSLATQIAVIEQGSITSHDGNYDDYLQLIKSAEKPRKSEPAPAKAQSYRNPKQRAEQTNRAKRVKELENRITELEGEIAELNGKMSLPEYVPATLSLRPFCSV